MTHPLIRPYALISAFLSFLILAFVPPSAAAQTINRPPSISGAPPTTVRPGQPYSFRPSARDPEGRTLTFHIANRPGWANFDRATGRLWGTPQTRNAGRFANIRISVSDGNSADALPAFTVTVGSTNSAPTISGTPPTSIRLGQSYNFRPNASDREGHALTFSIANKPGWATFNTSNGTLSGSPRATGRWSSITIRVSDGRASASLPAFTITAASATSTANTAPTISGSPPASVRAGQNYYFRPTASDREGNPLTFSIVNRPGWATFNSSNGTLTGTPGGGAVGTTFSGITIRVSDGRVTSALPSFSIAVQPASTGGGGGTGSISLQWVPPTRRTDGTLLTNLAGFRVRYGTSAGNQPNVIQIGTSGVTGASVTELAPGTWYFSVCAYDRANVTSAWTTPVSVTIR